VVVLDESNENEIIVEAGLKQGDKAFYRYQKNLKKFKFEDWNWSNRSPERRGKKKTGGRTTGYI